MNNLAVFHARDGYRDTEEKRCVFLIPLREVALPLGVRSVPSGCYFVLTWCSVRRHLVRLWLRDPENAWQTPTQLSGRWEHLYGGVTPQSQVFPLEPYIRSESHKAR